MKQHCMNWILVCNLCLLLNSGCGQSTPDSDQGPDIIKAPIDSRFQSAQALANYAKELLDQSPPDKGTFYRTMFYWETEDQKIWQRHIETIVLPIAQLNDVAMIHFGEKMSKSIQFEEFEVRDATIRKNEGNRAEGIFYDEAGHEHVLYLVEINYRWWISGYTIEYAGVEFLEILGGSTSDLAFFHETISPQIPVIKDIKNRILAGEFPSVYEVGEAMRAGIESVKRN